MKFLVDECVGVGVANWLRGQGHDAVSISELSPGIMDDAVLAKARDENRVLITMDKDFGDLVFRNNNDHCGIILLRILDWQLKHKIAVLENVLAHYVSELASNFMVVTGQSVRIIRINHK